MSSVLSNDINVILNNSFAAGLAYIGFLGFFIICAMHARLLKINILIIVSIMFLVFFAGGGITTMRIWAILSIYLFALQLTSLDIKSRDK